jgi:hypothetical protein
MKSEFSFKVNKDAAESTKVSVEYDISGLTNEELQEWAARGIDITLQSKLRSGNVKVEDVNGKTWAVPKPGDRKRLSEGDKVRKMVASLLGKKLEEVTDEEVMTVINRVMGKPASAEPVSVKEQQEHPEQHN